MSPQNKKIIFDRRYLIFSFFVIAASILWLINKISAEYSANLEFSINLKNSSTGEIYTQEADNTIYIQAKASGLFILRQRLLVKKDLNIDLKDKQLIRSADIFKLPSLALKDKISDILGPNVQITSIEPDSLFLKTTKPTTKVVPIIQNFKLQTKKEYMQTDSIRFKPNTITITGLAEIVDTITAIRTEFHEYKDLSESFEASISLENIDDIKFSLRKVKFYAEIERCTESEIKIPISVLHVPDSSSIVVLPSQVTVQYTVSLKEFPNIRPESFFATVDFNFIDSLPSRKLKVNLLQKPPQALSVKVIPEFVDFIQRKN